MVMIIPPKYTVSKVVRRMKGMTASLLRNRKTRRLGDKDFL